MHSYNNSYTRKDVKMEFLNYYYLDNFIPSVIYLLNIIVT